MQNAFPSPEHGVSWTAPRSSARPGRTRRGRKGGHRREGWPRTALSGPGGTAQGHPPRRPRTPPLPALPCLQALSPSDPVLVSHQGDFLKVMEFKESWPKGAKEPTAGRKMGAEMRGQLWKIAEWPFLKPSCPPRGVEVMPCPQSSPSPRTPSKEVERKRLGCGLVWPPGSPGPRRPPVPPPEAPGGWPRGRGLDLEGKC